MTQLWRAFGELVPLLAILGISAGALGITWRHLSGDGRRRVLGVILALWLAAVCLVTLRPEAEAWSPDASNRPSDLVPFRSLYHLTFNSVDWQVPAVQVIGNLALFAPLGFLAPLIWPHAKSALRRAVWAAAVVASLIEFTQWAMASGRVASIDDVVLAAAGAGLGWLFFQALSWRWPRAQLSASQADQ